LSALQTAGPHLNRFGGHHAAAGFELHAHKTPDFVTALRGHFQALQQNPQKLEMPYDVDLPVSEIQPSFLRWMDSLGPFGVGFEVPVFRISRLRVLAVTVLKGLHWKLSLLAPEGKLEALYFSPPPGRIRPEVGQELDLLGELQWNYFAGQQRIQILLKDFRLCEAKSASAEIPRAGETSP
jgi:single-stranded-DNA-specific exonuclease